MTECPECGTPVLVAPPVNVAVDEAPAAEDGGWWDRQPTWLLFVLVFAVGTALLVVTGSAVVVLARPAVVGMAEREFSWGSPSEATTTTALTSDASALVVGECIDADQLDNYLIGEDFETTDCTAPHDYEVYVIWEYESGPYPGDEVVKAELADACLDGFETYVGRDFESSSLDFYRTWPGREVWEAGYRVGECLLFHVDEQQLEGSAYQSGW